MLSRLKEDLSHAALYIRRWHIAYIWWMTVFIFCMTILRYTCQVSEPGAWGLYTNVMVLKQRHRSAAAQPWRRCSAPAALPRSSRGSRSKAVGPALPWCCSGRGGAISTLWQWLRMKTQECKEFDPPLRV